MSWNRRGLSGESVPSGLASTILAERSGSLLSERLSIRLGDALPQLGDAIVESEGTVFLQSFDVDCAALTADLQFGVPDYLSPEDMASLLSSFRNKCTSSSSTIRKTGKAEDKGSDVKMGAIPPLSSTEFAPGTKSKTTIKGSSGGGSISLDSSELAEGEKIAVREVTTTVNGETKTIKVLATEDLNTEEEDEPLEPGADPDEPYEDPEEEEGEDAIDGDGNEISNDAGSLDDDNGDYCNSIFGGGSGVGRPPGNGISNTCSK